MLRNIHSYFIQRRIKKEHVTATKPFKKGFRIYAAHNVQTISLNVVTTSTYTVIKAAVRPSQRQDHTYQAYIHVASETNGTILHATCTCIAVSCGACNHTAAVMFAIDEHNITRPSCSTKLHVTTGTVAHTTGAVNITSSREHASGETEI